MQFLLTDQDALEAIRTGIRRDDGLLLIDLPVNSLQDTNDLPLRLQFSPDSHTVHWGKSSLRLSPTLYSLLHYLNIRNRVTFEELQDVIWGKRISDNAIYQAASRLSSWLIDAGIPWTCFTRQSAVILEKISQS